MQIMKFLINDFSKMLLCSRIMGCTGDEGQVVVLRELIASATRTAQLGNVSLSPEMSAELRDSLLC